MAPIAQQPQAAQAQAAPARPFITGSRGVDDFVYDVTKTLTAGQQKLDTFELDTDGFTAGLYILCEATGAGNATVTAAFKEDGPFSAYDVIQFNDTNGKPILGPFTGHDLYEAVKFGGYHYQDDAKASSIYSVTSGTGAAQGSFTFALYLPIEIVHRDALGSLLNKSASAVFKLSLTLAANTTVYSAVPATSVSVRTRIAQFGWMDSDTRDVKGNPTSANPPALNTVQFWDKQTWSPASGSMAQKLNTFSGGIRNLVFMLRDSNATRSGNSADWPDPFSLYVDKMVPLNRLAKVWRHVMTEDFGYTGAEVLPGVSGTPATEGGKMDNGVYAIPFTKDFGLKPGAENRFGYLWVTSATSILMKGTVGAGSATHSLDVLINYVNPANGDPRSLTGGR